VDSVPAVFRDGAFYPLQPVEIPEQTNVVVMLPQNPEKERQVESILKTAGVWADLPGVDDVLQQMEDIRQAATFRDEVT
jgi:predicted DNA-binding antitoxin AbrB/MazE fold protein